MLMRILVGAVMLTMAGCSGAAALSPPQDDSDPAGRSPEARSDAVVQTLLVPAADDTTMNDMYVANGQLATPAQRYQRLEAEITQLADEYRRLAQVSTSSKHPVLLETRQKLEQRVKAAFDLRQQMREAEIAQLRKRLEHVEAQISQRHKARNEIVSKRVDTLLDPDRDFGSNNNPFSGFRPTTPYGAASSNPFASPGASPATIRGGDPYLVPGMPPMSPPRGATGSAREAPAFDPAAPAAEVDPFGEQRLSDPTVPSSETTAPETSASGGVDPFAAPASDPASATLPSATPDPAARSSIWSAEGMNLRMKLLETAEQLSSAIKRQDHKQRAPRERTYRALRRELDAAMIILQFECKHQESQIGTATETIRYTEQLYSKGYISSDQVTAEKAKLESLRNELEKLRAVVELYHQVREESESMIRDATKANTQPSDPNTGDPTDGGTAAEGTNEASFESSDATGREFDSGTTAEGVQDDSTSRPDLAPPGDNF